MRGEKKLQSPILALIIKKFMDNSILCRFNFRSLLFCNRICREQNRSACCFIDSDLKFEVFCLRCAIVHFDSLVMKNFTFVIGSFLVRIVIFSLNKLIRLKFQISMHSLIAQLNLWHVCAQACSIAYLHFCVWFDLHITYY